MSNILKGLTEGYYSRDEEYQQNAMDTRRRSDLSSERNAGLDEPDEYSSKPAQVRNGIYEYDVPAGQEKIAQDLGLQQHRGHWISRFPIQRANFQFGLPQFHEIPAKGVAEGSAQEPTIHDYHRARDELSKIPKGTDEHTQAVIDIQKLLKAVIAAEKKQQQGVAEGLNEPPVSYREMINSVQKQYTKWYSELVNHYAQLGNSSDEFKKKIVAAYNAYKNGQSVAHIPIVGPVKEQGVAEGSIEEALQAPPTSTGNELLDEFIGRYVKDGWKYHGTNKRGGHEFRKRRYMPAALYGLKDGGVIESHNNGTRVSRFDSSGKRVAKLADGPLSEQGVAEGFGDVVKGIKRKVSGKEDPKDVEHTYGRIARSAIKHKTPDQAEKDIKRWEKVNKVVNKEGVAEGEYNPDTFVGKKGTYKGYGITQEGPSQWGISSSARKFPTLNAAKRHIDKNLVAEGSGFDKWADDRAASQLHKLKPGMVQDRKTGKWYDPKKEFDKKMNSPEVMAQMKRMAQKEGVAEGLSKRDLQDVAAIKAAIERLQAQLSHPNADKADIQQSIAHEKKRLELYGKDLAEDQRLDPSCWKGYKKQGTKMKGDTRVNNCVPVKESAILQGLNQLDEGWKEKLGAAALAGSLALGAGAAHSRVTPDGEGGVTGGLNPTATVTAPSDNKPAAEAPRGFSKEYLQKAADPNRIGRYMISVEKAQELLKSMP